MEYEGKLYGKSKGIYFELTETAEDIDRIKEENRQLIIMRNSLAKAFSDPSKEFLDNVCMSYRHDFGLMSEERKQDLRNRCKWWLIAMGNNLDNDSICK